MLRDSYLINNDLHRRFEEIMENTEDRVIEELEDRAKCEGWTTIEKHLGNEPGVDLKLGKD